LSQELDHLRAAGSAPQNGRRTPPNGGAPDEPILNLRQIMFEAAVVPETIRVDKLLTEFKRSRQQMAIVIDEYGGTVGLVTLADLLEEVFGDMPDEADEEAEPEILKRPDGSLQLAGGVSIDEVNELFGFGFPTDQAVTMAGLVLNALGRIAAVGDEVEINGLRLRVEQVDRFRIATLGLFLPVESSNEQPPANLEEE
jgi:CBS domain containing-hemolysin-like protein